MTRGLLQSTPSMEERSETDNITAIELQRNRRVLYFSDGTMEEPSDNEDENETDEPDKCLDVEINEHDLALLPRLKYKAGKVGSNILAGIDYVGGGLASFFGITKPKYACSSDYYQRTLEANNDKDSNANRPWYNNESENNLDNVITVSPKPTEHDNNS